MKKLAIAIFAFCLLESVFFFGTGWWAFSVYRFAGATAAQSFTIAEGDWTIGLLIVMAGFLHWIAPRLRLPLAVAGVFGGIYGARLMIHYPNFLASWDILHGNLAAIGNWSSAILITLGVLCAAEIVLLAIGRT